jgi:hypothetical protein
MKKFRVWDKQNKLFINKRTKKDIVPDFFIGQDGKLYHKNIDGNIISCIEKYFVVCFETDFKDKTGKRIYEGDILVTSNDGKDGCDVWEKEDNGYTYYFPRSKDDVCSRWSSWCVEKNGGESVYEEQYVKIVGNIFENPELKKK